MKIIAVIPAYNEQETIGNIVRETLCFADEVLVVNDGSSDRTLEIARGLDAKVLNLRVNCGLGSALRVGIKAALSRGAEIVITLDADGQHNPADIKKMTEPILKDEADVVVGTRMGEKGMPAKRRMANFTANFITFILFGIWVKDSQSGFRAFGKRAAELIDLKTNRMEISSEIISEIKNKNLRLAEIPIKPVYTKYSMSKGQNFFVGIETAFKLFLRRLNK
jgi:glycosyltransferase involved in cell wall biosynthesis